MLVLKTIGTYTLLVFGLLANAASIAGFWLSYASATPDTQVRFGRFLLFIGSIGGAVAYLAVACLLFLRLRKRNDKDISSVSRTEVSAQREIPDVAVKDSDPKIYVEFKDDRYLTGPGFSGEKNARFVLVNRGLAYAKFVCLDHIRLREQIIKVAEFAQSLAPRESIGFHPAIERYDAKDSTGCDIFRALFVEWEALNRSSR